MATAVATTTMPSSSSCSRDSWPDLPDELLHLILTRLCRFQDLLAFSSACRSWRSFARSTISASPTPLFPPLFIRPLLLYRSRRRRRLPVSTLKLIDPAIAPPITARKAFYRSPIEESVLTLPFLSSSHGHLLFLSSKCEVLIFNFITGCQIVSPALPPINYDRQYRSLAQLTAPVSSPSCTLIFLTVNYLLLWKVSSPHWISHRLPVHFHCLKQMVVVETRIWVLESENRISILEMSQDSCPKVLVVQWEKWRWDTLPGSTSKDMRLVDCKGEILGVCFVGYVDGIHVQVEVFRIELMASNQLKLVKKINIGNWAYFMSDSVHVPGSVCNNPERWGGKRNCVYYARGDDKEDWSVFEVGQIARWWFFKKANRLTCSFPFWDFGTVLR